MFFTHKQPFKLRWAFTILLSCFKKYQNKIKEIKKYKFERVETRKQQEHKTCQQTFGKWKTHGGFRGKKVYYQATVENSKRKANSHSKNQKGSGI